MSQDKYRYRIEIQQMMFVSGETEDPVPDTLSLIEDIVREQVIEIVLQSSKTALARGSKSISPEDVIFLIRHDRAKVNRLRTYLSWKDVRKNAKDQEEGNLGTGNELLEDATTNANNGPGGTGKSASQNDIDNKMKNFRKSKIRLPWELQFMFYEQPMENPLADEQDAVDDDEKEATIASLKRLKTNDDRTKYMTKEEYVHWSECRQASFTFRKAKRFREWCGLSQLTDQRPQDDVIDILGFLTFEMVCSITEEALRVKALEEENLGDEIKITNKKKRNRHYLFDPPDNSSYPITPGHIEEAWRRLQSVSFEKRCIKNFKGGRLRSRARLI
ncbi:hypothetical protein PACTADRAFT_32971 [Pachysolen tannophilus NRRL Y-2460]|uniref:Uncharacterized protein n=1 Tax=Pachysolen tannophilus NRRL Y-2460 TaxID=669874 RepID=A0A1E4TVH2_PACTA|nr:hypothetical protein PACTADRAFT_32971 [Pachysolen tannophilus NRRL Y-2460]